MFKIERLTLKNTINYKLLTWALIYMPRLTYDFCFRLKMPFWSITSLFHINCDVTSFIRFNSIFSKKFIESHLSRHRSWNFNKMTSLMLNGFHFIEFFMFLLFFIHHFHDSHCIAQTSISFSAMKNLLEMQETLKMNEKKEKLSKRSTITAWAWWDRKHK